MNFVQPYLAIGSLRETYDRPYLEMEGIGAMLQVAAWVEQRNIVTRYLPIEDGVPLRASTIAEAVAFVREHKQADRKTLIACALGVSRSVTLAVAAVKELEGVSLLDAWREVKWSHPDARPHPVLWQSLCDYYGESLPYTVVLRHPALGIVEGPDLPPPPPMPTRKAQTPVSETILAQMRRVDPNFARKYEQKNGQ